MKVGDLVKHKWGTISGTGIITLIIPYFKGDTKAHVLWTSSKNSNVIVVRTKNLGVINECR